MDDLLLNFLIISFVLCFVLAIFILIISHRIPKIISYIFVSLHVLLGVTSLVLFFRHYAGYLAIAFSSFVFTGILLFALVVRKNFSLPIKIYTSVFILTLPLFILSPSKLISIITVGHLSSTHAGEINIKDNYFLVKEHGMIQQQDSVATYKIIKRRGLFNQTLARGIHIGFSPDSVKFLFLDEKSEIQFRVYHVGSSIIDSAEISANLILKSDSLINISKKTQQ
ncbi:MAG: hypothetical protein JSS90_10260 [Bacteroidetes bacterium]|jgi:hypothetical protein|nr:hypothetical protein [Bacteroidota bacterium]